MSKNRWRENIRRRAYDLQKQNDPRGDSLYEYYNWIKRGHSNLAVKDYWLEYKADDIADWVHSMNTYGLTTDEKYEAFEALQNGTYRDRANLSQFDLEPRNLQQEFIRYVITNKGGYATREWFKNKFPGEYTEYGGLTLPGQNYVGPGNPMYNKISNELDSIAAEHDILYSKATTADDIHKADELFIKRINDYSLSGGEWLKAALAKYAISTKLFFERRTGVWYGLNKGADLRLTNGKPEWDYKHLQSIHYKGRSHLLKLLDQKVEIDKYKDHPTSEDYINEADEYIDHLIDNIRYA